MPPLEPLLRLGAGAWEAAEAFINEDRIRLAVTGLSRAGKTVFITSMVQNLLALSGGRDTLPALRKHLSRDGGSRLHRITLVPAGAATVPRFDHAGNLAALCGANPAWPARTQDVAELSLVLEIERATLVGRSLPPRRVRLDILDYPGEWLLDLPMLELSFAEWSRMTLARLREGPQAGLAAEFLAFLAGVPAGAAADEAVLRRGHRLYRALLEACRATLGLRYLQPGRFLCPGPREEVPFMWFFPIDPPGGPVAGASAVALLAQRFEAYKADMRAQFFDTHFRAFDRQILLVDVLGALHAGEAAFDDTARAIGDLCRGLRGGGGWFGLDWLPGGRGPIRHVAVVATKADHVPAMRRDNLRHLLGTLTASGVPGGATKVSRHVAAAVLSTVDEAGQLGGHSVEMVKGVLLGEDRARAVFTGDVPAGLPPASFWSGGYFDLPVFRPPLIDGTGRSGIPQLGIDEILVALLEDLL